MLSQGSTIAATTGHVPAKQSRTALPEALLALFFPPRVVRVIQGGWQTLLARVRSAGLLSRRLWLLSAQERARAAASAPLLDALRRTAQRGLDLRLRLRGALQAQLSYIHHSPITVPLRHTAARLARLHWGWQVTLAGAALPLLWVIVTTPLPLWGQTVFFLYTLLAILVVRQFPGRVALLVMICTSCVATLRYAWWRLTQTLDLEYNTDYIMGVPLLIAELYTWTVLFLGYIQTAWPLKRASATLPADTAQWPTVDVFIPTYNEPLAVVRPTVLSALNMDWPRDRIRFYILDDGRREAFREFAAQAGVEYIARGYNSHAKAGNLNHAIKHSQGEFIAIFDCDHMPTRSFLTASMGWFLKDRRCALVQTPHNFFAPDPFEKNLQNFRQVPNEGELFYGLVQDGSDFWNATFFCGSCAILRRGPLERIGGIAVETVTEDAHTALKLHRLGYTTAYLNSIQASGLATESLSGHVGQRIRWARGMAQIFRIDNPLLGKGLSLAQRLCYCNSMLHFFYGIPRLLFLIAPLSYLYFGLHIINAQALTLALYALPHMMHANLSNSRLQGRYRYSFWASIYESVLAWYIVIPTTLAFINPRLGKFNVTVKGGLLQEAYFDWRIAVPYLVLFALNISGFLIGIGRFFWWNAHEPGPVLLNLTWAGFNLITLGATLGVAAEARQIRRNHRIPAWLPAAITLPDGVRRECMTEDFSLGGLSLLAPASISVTVQQTVEVTLSEAEHSISLQATVVRASPGRIGVQFGELTLAQEAALLRCTFGRPEVWERWREAHREDRLLRSMFNVLRLSAQGYGRALHFLGRAIVARRRVPSRILAETCSP